MPEKVQELFFFHQNKSDLRIHSKRVFKALRPHEADDFIETISARDIELLPQL
jgi:hypothetical protein